MTRPLLQRTLQPEGTPTRADRRSGLYNKWMVEQLREEAKAQGWALPITQAPENGTCRRHHNAYLGTECDMCVDEAAAYIGRLRMLWDGVERVG